MRNILLASTLAALLLCGATSAQAGTDYVYKASVPDLQAPSETPEVPCAGGSFSLITATDLPMYVPSGAVAVPIPPGCTVAAFTLSGGSSSNTSTRTGRAGSVMSGTLTLPAGSHSLMAGVVNGGWYIYGWTNSGGGASYLTLDGAPIAVAGGGSAPTGTTSGANSAASATVPCTSGSIQAGSASASGAQSHGAPDGYYYLVTRVATPPGVSCVSTPIVTLGSYVPNGAGNAIPIIKANHDAMNIGSVTITWQKQ